MISTISVFNRFLFTRPRHSTAALFIAILLLARGPTDAAVIEAQSASRADVGAAVAAAQDGDTVTIPAGTATWTTTLTVGKNIQIIGAGESSTVINENLSRTGSPPIIQVTLTHESSPPDYSFRLSGMTFHSSNQSGTALASDHAFIMLSGLSHTTDSPVPYVHGCVSRVRIDHLTWDNLNGLALLVDSCLGVADHITQTTTTSVYQAYPIKVFMNNWTPATNPDTGMALPTSYLAAKGFGSWADDPYWGTDKFWFFEDCNFTVPDSTNVADDEIAARVVFRHCTFNGGGGVASHGMEGRAQPGIKQQEVYNNYFVTNRLFAQHRGGSALYFNNKSTAMPKGMSFYVYRQSRTETNWGGTSGDNRYDNNAGGEPIYTGTVTSTNGTDTITDSNQSNFNSIDMTDGAIYNVNDLDDPADSTLDPGWKYKHGTVAAVGGKTLTLNYESGTGGDSTYGDFGPKWAIGHHYEIRKVLAAYGQPGQGKGSLLNTVVGQNSYITYKYPATSGPKATYPQAGFPLEPCYSWNNTDGVYGYLGFYIQTAGDVNKGLLANRDYFNLGERAIATQKVGWPEQDYARATNDYPKIGPGQTVAYTPYIYPHPLTVDEGSQPDAPQNLKILP
jgi:hypothetical protein